MTENKPFTFYANNIQVKSFFDEKAKKQRYMVGGYISTGDLDLVNDIATEDCRRDLSEQFKGRKIKLDYDHETIRADRNQDEFDSRLNLTKPVLGKAVSEENDGVGNMVWFELNPNWKKFDLQGNVTMDFKSVWEDIENGYYDAFSIAYVPTKTRMMTKGGSQIRLLDKVNLINVALTGNPVNPAARMMDFRTVMAKSLEYMKEKEDGNMQDADVKSRLDKIEEDIADVKAKYVRRWRGRDGKYQYDYGEGGKQSGTNKKESGKLSENDANKLYDEATNEILDGNTNPEKIADNLEKIRGIDADREELLEIAKDAIESEKQIAKENPEASPLGNKKPKWKSHSQEPNGGIMMESEKKSEANAEAQSEKETQPEPQAKANKDYEDKPADDSEDEQDKKEGKSLEIDAKSFAEMKSEVADLKSKVEELEKQNKDMKSILEEARPAAKGPEDEQQKQAKSQPNGVPFKGPLDLI
jgi:hypothetical protein